MSKQLMNFLIQNKVEEALELISTLDVLELNYHYNSPDLPDSNMSPLHLACALGMQTVVEGLIEKGSDLLSFSSNGSGIMHWACTHEGDDTSVLKALNSANPYALFDVDKSRRTPLHYASNAGSLPRVQCLLAMGAVPDSKDCDQKTPADVTDEQSIQKELRSAMSLTLLAARAIRANEELYAHRELLPEILRDLVEEQGPANVGYLRYCRSKRRLLEEQVSQTDSEMKEDTLSYKLSTLCL